jgi:hypothetical protein
MLQEPDPTLLRISLLILQWLGVSSLAGFLALYAAWLGFPPELVIEDVADKSHKFSSESRIRIKNNGRLPALGIRADVPKFRAKAGDNVLEVSREILVDELTPRLAGGESTLISISPGINFEGGAQISECSYELTLVYHAKLFWLRREFRKVWRVELVKARAKSRTCACCSMGTLSS